VESEKWEAIEIKAAIDICHDKQDSGFSEKLAAGNTQGI
jgi:hypothetical protein